MIEYIYFVKCPNCEDEHFYFFNDAKECAMSQLSKKPIITQTEVNRNDFGECTDSCDLGTVWSWEDMMKDAPVDSERTTFAKADTLECDNCFDPEFDELDNSLDVPVARKPVPADMTIESLVEEMEENEDTVECKVCEELYDKAKCQKDPERGWVCEACCGTKTESLNNSKTWICFFEDQEIGTVTAATRAEALEAMMNEYPEYPYSIYDGCFTVEPEDGIDPDYEEITESCDTALTEASKYKDSVEFHYDNLTVDIVTKVIPATRWDPEDYEEGEYTGNFDFEVDTNTVKEVLWNEFITEEDVEDIPGGLEALEDDAAWEAYLDTHFEELLKKYNDKFLEYFKEDAEEEAREVFRDRYVELHSEGPDPDRAYDEWRDSQYFEEECPRQPIEESMDPDELVELEYPSLTVTLQGPKQATDDWEEIEHTANHVFLVPKGDIATVIWENWITEEDAEDVLGGLKTLEDDKLWNLFLEDHFDILFEKYNKQILDYYREEATEDFRERSQEDSDLTRFVNNTKPKSYLEELEESADYHKHLVDCPECGVAESFDHETGICINCGFNI